MSVLLYRSRKIPYNFSTKIITPSSIIKNAYTTLKLINNNNHNNTGICTVTLIFSGSLIRAVLVTDRYR